MVSCSKHFYISYIINRNYLKYYPVGNKLNDGVVPGRVVSKLTTSGGGKVKNTSHTNIAVCDFSVIKFE